MTAAANDSRPRRKGADLPPGAKLSYTVDESGAALGLSAATIWDMLKNGELTAKRVRGRTVIVREELQRVLDEAPDARAA